MEIKITQFPGGFGLNNSHNLTFFKEGISVNSIYSKEKRYLKKMKCLLKLHVHASFKK